MPRLNIAIKLPRIYLRNGFGTIVTYLRARRPMVFYKKEIFSWTVYHDATIKSWSFRGIVDNRHEYVFYQKTKNPFLLPTYFSFFGLFNIQKLGNELKIDSIDLWCQLYEITEGLVFKCSHHFTFAGNFSLKNGKIQILDYGDPRVQEVIEKDGLLIQEKFDLNYSWEKRKAEMKEKK